MSNAGQKTHRENNERCQLSNVQFPPIAQQFTATANHGRSLYYPMHAIDCHFCYSLSIFVFACSIYYLPISSIFHFNFSPRFRSAKLQYKTINSKEFNLKLEDQKFD